MGADLNLLSSLTLSKAQGQRRRLAGEPERQLPGAAGHSQSRRRLRAVSGYHQPYNSTTSFVWSLPFGKGKRWGSNMSTAMDLIAGGWQLAGINTITPGEMVTFTYTPAAAFQVSGITNDFSRRQQLPAEPDLRSVRGVTVDHALVQPDLRRAADRSEPAVRQRAAQQRARAELLAGGPRGDQELRGRRSRQGAVPPRGVQSVQPRSTSRAPNGNRSSAAFGTITSTFDARQMQLGLKLLW